MIFDGKKGVRFTYNGKEYKEVIVPEVAEDDPDLEGIWQYRLDTDDENLSMVLHGSYDDEGNLSTYGVLQVRVQDAATDADEYIDDIDVIGMEEVAEKKKVWVVSIVEYKADENYLDSYTELYADEEQAKARVDEYSTKAIDAAPEHDGLDDGGELVGEQGYVTYFKNGDIAKVKYMEKEVK